MFMKSNWQHGRRIFRSSRYGSTLGWATNGWDGRSATTTMTLSGRFGMSQQPTLEPPSLATADKLGAEVDGRHGRARDLS